MSERLVLFVRKKRVEMDEEDSELISSALCFSLTDKGYVVVEFENNKKVLLHRLIMGKHKSIEGKVIHHKDADKLNNKKSNLSVVTNAENSRGKSKQRRSTHKFKGYKFRETSYGDTFQCTVGFNHKRYILGTYATEIDAAIAYDLGALKYIGPEVAILNFPDKDYSDFSIESWMQEKSIKHRPGKTKSQRTAKEPEPGLAMITQCQWVVSSMPVPVMPAPVPVPVMPAPVMPAPVPVPVMPALKYALSVKRMANTIGLSRARFYQLINLNIMPVPDKTSLDRPFYSLEKQKICESVIASGLGVNGEPVVFYEKQKKQ